MKAIKNAIDNTLKFVMATSSLILFVVTFLQVIFRFLFKSPIPWSQDAIRLCFTYLVFFGAAYCVKEKSHLNIDVVIGMFKPKMRKVTDILTNLILLAFFVFLAFYGFQFAMSGATQVAPYLPIPMSVYYASVPLSAVLMFFYMSIQTFEQIRDFNKQEEGK